MQVSAYAADDRAARAPGDYQIYRCEKRLRIGFRQPLC